MLRYNMKFHIDAQCKILDKNIVLNNLKGQVPNLKKILSFEGLERKYLICLLRHLLSHYLYPICGKCELLHKIK